MEPIHKSDLKSQFRLVSKMVRRYARSTEDADEIKQNVFVKLLTSKYVPVFFYPWWLSTVVRNASADFYRSVKREEQWLNRDVWISTIGCIEDNPCVVLPEEPALDDNDVLEAVVAVLKCLPETEARALVLHAHGFTYADIAKCMGAKVGTVRSRIHNGRARARQLLQAV
jgi:RNA polymerase sigma-70 factor (ECF subfamily)